MARPKNLTVTELDKLYGQRIASVTVQNGIVTGFALFPPKPDQILAAPGRQEPEEGPDAVDLAFNPPKGMFNPAPEYIPEQN